MNPDCLETDLRTPCRFLAACAESRRRIQATAGLRGSECWAFELRTAGIVPLYQPPERPVDPLE